MDARTRAGRHARRKLGLTVAFEDPVLRASAATRAALGLGIVFIMVVKPAAVGVVIVFAIALAIGAATVLARGAGLRGVLARSE